MWLPCASGPFRVSRRGRSRSAPIAADGGSQSSTGWRDSLSDQQYRIGEDVGHGARSADRRRSRGEGEQPPTLDAFALSACRWWIFQGSYDTVSTRVYHASFVPIQYRKHGGPPSLTWQKAPAVRP